MKTLVGAPWGKEVAAKVTGDDRYAFFLNWSQRVGKEWTDNYECVNFHCTALPYGRGGHPIENLILNGHTSTVITAHRMTEEIDAGPIYATCGPVSLDGTKDEILARFVNPVADLIEWIAEAKPTPIPQTGEPTYFKRLNPDEYERFWKERQCLS